MNVSENNITETCYYEITEEELAHVNTLSNILNDYGQLVVCVGGLFFNIITILLFQNKKLLDIFFNRLLLCLCIIDSIYLIITIMYIWLSSSESQTFSHKYAFYFIVLPARGIAMCCTIYMMVILSLERYRSITSMNPRATSQVSWARVLKYVGPVVLFCTLFKFPGFLEFDLESTNGTFNNSPFVVGGPWVHASSENAYNVSTRMVVTNMRIHELYILLYRLLLYTK